MKALFVIVFLALVAVVNAEDALVEVEGSKYCSTLTVANSVAGSFAGNTYNTYTLTCKYGYAPSVDTFNCKTTGKWSGDISCNQIQCESIVSRSLGNGANGQNPIIGNLDATYSVTCQSNYLLKGESTIKCIVDPADSTAGKWVTVNGGDFPQCKTADCGATAATNLFNLIDNLAANSPYQAFSGSAVSVVCKSGYQVASGNVKVQCKSTGWVTPLPTCSPRRCPKLHIRHGADTFEANAGSNTVVECVAPTDENGQPLDGAIKPQIIWYDASGKEHGPSETGYAFCDKAGRWIGKPVCYIPPCCKAHDRSTPALHPELHVPDENPDCKSNNNEWQCMAYKKCVWYEEGNERCLHRYHLENHRKLDDDEVNWQGESA